jgi:hypothetical protein
MKGSIRVVVGFLITFGAVGGLDNAADSQLLGLLVLAIGGLIILTSGVLAVKSQ